MRGKILLILLVIISILLIVQNYNSNKELKEVDENIEKSLLLDKECLINLGSELCIQKGTTIKQVYINEFEYTGTFSCFDLPRTNITLEQLKECSNGKK